MGSDWLVVRSAAKVVKARSQGWRNDVRLVRKPYIGRKAAGEGPLPLPGVHSSVVWSLLIARTHVQNQLTQTEPRVPGTRGETGS